MSEQESLYEQKFKPLTARSILTTTACVIAANVFKELGWPFIVGIALTFAVALVIEYWIPPRPPVSFLVWLIKVGYFFALILIGLWVIPRFLSRWIWHPIAYGLPAFILFASLYWIPTMYPRKRREASWKWIAFSLTVGLIFAVIGYFVPYA